MHAGAERGDRGSSRTCDVAIPAHPAVPGGATLPPVGRRRRQPFFPDRPEVGQPVPEARTGCVCAKST
jgi:hypothetical protein